MKEGHWELTGMITTDPTKTIPYVEKRCSQCGFTHSLVSPDKYCPECGSHNEGKYETVAIRIETERDPHDLCFKPIIQDRRR